MSDKEEFNKVMRAQFDIVLALLCRENTEPTVTEVLELTRFADSKMREAGYTGPEVHPSDLTGIAVLGLVAALRCFEVSGAAETVGRALGADLRADTLLLALAANPQGTMHVVEEDSELGKVVGAAMQDDEMDRRAKEMFPDG